MKNCAPSLAPLLRSDAQGLMLAELFIDPTKEHSLSALAQSSGTAVPTVMRDVNRLVEAGFAIDRRVGATRLVRANSQHPVFSAVRELVLYAYGPIAVLTPMMGKIKNLRKAFIYGSWAERVSGSAGEDPGDIDVLLIMAGSSYDAFEIAAEATKAMGREVNVQNVSEEEWNTANSAFVKTVKSKPLIELDLGE